MPDYLLITAWKAYSNKIVMVILSCCEGAWNFNLEKPEL